MARSFSNSGTDKITLNAALVIGSANPFTLSAWVYPTSGGSGNFQAIWGSQQNAYVEFQITNTSKISLVSNFTVAVGTSTGSVTFNAWNHIGCSYSGTTLNFYINGALDSGSPITNTVSITNNTDGLFLGNTQHSEFFQGYMADAAAWNVASINTNEFNAMFNGVRARFIRPASNVAFLPLDGIESPEPDLSGNAYNGTLSGTAFVVGPPATFLTPRWPMGAILPATAAATHLDRFFLVM